MEGRWCDTCKLVGDCSAAYYAWGSKDCYVREEERKELNKPTEEQIKELLERCGLHYEAPCWVDENNNLAFYGEVYSELLRSIDLNSLFEQAVPVAITKLETRFDEQTNKIRALQLLFAKWIDKIREGYSLKDALFWALYPVLKESEK